LSRNRSPPGLTSPFGGTLAFADVDGDSRVDAALLVTSNLRSAGRTEATLRLSSGRHIALTHPAALAPGHVIEIRDYDHDQDNDVVIETAFAEPLLVWINKNDGRFEAVHLARVPGAGERVADAPASFNTGRLPPVLVANLPRVASPAVVETGSRWMPRQDAPYPRLPESSLIPDSAFCPAVPIRGSPLKVHS
jgi:hypothetical protein